MHCYPYCFGRRNELHLSGCAFALHGKMMGTSSEVMGLILSSFLWFLSLPIASSVFLLGDFPTVSSMTLFQVFYIYIFQIQSSPLSFFPTEIRGKGPCCEVLMDMLPKVREKALVWSWSIFTYLLIVLVLSFPKKSVKHAPSFLHGVEEGSHTSNDPSSFFQSITDTVVSQMCRSLQHVCN